MHINAGVAGLVGAYVIGKRIGYGKEAMAPHNLTMTMIGASLLWVGWFGFNAGSALEAGDVAALAFINTLVATAGAVLSWTFGEWMIKGKPSMLGAASGAVAGLVAITPACGFVGIGGALVIGLLAGVVCLWGVNGLKRMLGADDALDVFGVHGVGGILGALLTGVFAAPSLGGQGVVRLRRRARSADYSIMRARSVIQAKAVGTTIVWSGVVAFVAYKIVDLVDRPARDRRRGARRSRHQLARRIGLPHVGVAGRITRGRPAIARAARKARGPSSPAQYRSFSSVALRGAPNGAPFFSRMRRSPRRRQVTGAGLNSTSALCSFQCSAQVFLRPLATSSIRRNSSQPTSSMRRLAVGNAPGVHVHQVVPAPRQVAARGHLDHRAPRPGRRACRGRW